jgi:hypothetical protein
VDVFIIDKKGIRKSQKLLNTRLWLIFLNFNFIFNFIFFNLNNKQTR